MASLCGVTLRRVANLLLAATLVYATAQLWNGRTAGHNDGEARTADLSRRSDRSKIARKRACELDRSYLPGITFQPGHANRCRFAEEIVNGVDVSTTIVMGRLQNETEKVQWLFDDVTGIQEKWVYVVDDSNSTLPHLARNHGREAAVYLTYIVENYDSLSNITFFWHPDRIVWHNNMMLNWDSVETLHRMNYRNILNKGYVPARCDQWPGCPSWITFNPSAAEHQLDPHRLEALFTPELFSKLFPDASVFPPYFAETCCSQFAVSQETIRNQPLSTYKRLLDWVTEYSNDDDSGRVMEFIWQYVFLGQGTLCPTMQNCYCQTYDLCFENQVDVERLESWNALRTRREEVKWQVNFIKTQMETTAQDMRSRNEPVESIAANLEGLRPEFERLSAELDRLGQQTWLERENIIHRWHLDIPPVGW